MKDFNICYQYPYLRNKWWCVTAYLQVYWKKSMIFLKFELWYLQSAFGSDEEKH